MLKVCIFVCLEAAATTNKVVGSLRSWAIGVVPAAVLRTKRERERERDRASERAIIMMGGGVGGGSHEHNIHTHIYTPLIMWRLCGIYIYIQYVHILAYTGI